MACGVGGCCQAPQAEAPEAPAAGLRMGFCWLLAVTLSFVHLLGGDFSFLKLAIAIWNETCVGSLAPG